MRTPESSRGNLPYPMKWSMGVQLMSSGAWSVMAKPSSPARAAAAAISSTVEKPSGLASVWVWESTTSCMETPLLNDGGAPWSAAKRSARTEAAAQAPGTRRQRYPSSMSPSTSPPSYATAQARTMRRSRTSYTLYPLSRRKRTARTGAPPAGRTSHGSA